MSGDTLTMADISATGAVFAGKAKVYSVVLTPAAATATVVLRDTDGSGTVMLRLQGGANQAAIVWNSDQPMLFPVAVHATIGGAGANVSVGYIPA